MNKSEISELRKQIKKGGLVLSDVWCCYVDSEKNRVFTQKEPLEMLTEEKSDEYYARLKKVLSGALGKNLYNLDFPDSEEAEGGRQHQLWQLYKSKLDDVALVDQFLDKLTREAPIDDHYFVMMVYGAYDVPGYTGNGEAMEDASESVYDFMLCSICPVKQTRPFLSYDPYVNGMENKVPDWEVGQPMTGFLFPAFNDRADDIHSALYYVSKPGEVSKEMIESLFGSAVPLSSVAEREGFNQVMSGTPGTMTGFDEMVSVQEQIMDMIAENDSEEAVMLDKEKLSDIMKTAGISEPVIEEARQVYDDNIGSLREVMAENVIDVKKIRFQSTGIDLRVDAEHMDRVETRTVEGRRCLLVFVDEPFDMNGVPVIIKEGLDD